MMLQRGMMYAFLVMLILASAVCAEDLYRVDVTSEEDAKALIQTGFDAVVRLDKAYLVIAKAGANEVFESRKLNFRLVSSDVDRNELAVDAAFDPQINAALTTVHEENNIRLVRVPDGIRPNDIGYSGLTPLPKKGLRVVYRKPVTLSPEMFNKAISYDSLIGLVEYDSLLSYSMVLQSYPNRLTGQPGNHQTRDWIISKLQDFGLDSIYVDTFTASLGQAYNVVGVKVGTTFPDHEIVLGGHRDAVSGSPGADDNGSGTLATMEMARVLNNIETNMTFKYVLFDAEEQGLYGSWDYADQAAANGDSIVMMQNLDMCAYISNDSQAKLYHGTDTTYVGIWKYLAANLDGIDIAGEFSGNISASDHWPFHQNGYDVSFPFEYVFSTVYHSPRDSTSYMNFDYFTRMVQASLATAYYVDNNYIPTPSLEFTYRDGSPPAYLVPGVETSFGVSAVGTSGGVPVPGTGQIHYSINGGPVQTDNMTQSTPNAYTAVLPAVGCDDTIEYYLSAEETTEGRIYDPLPSLPLSPPVATSLLTAFEDDFETDLGWTISGGSWARGTPTGGSGSHGGPDPTSGHSGSNVIGYNLSGGYTNNMFEMHITSPAIDCSDMANTHLKFYRWLGVEQSQYDHAYVRISTNESSWTNIWENGATIDDGEWVEQEYDISGYADGQATVYIRFTMGETDGSWTYCGWNIDDVVISGFSCVDAIQISTTEFPDWTANEYFSQQLEALGGVGELTWVDKYGDLSATGLTLSSDGILSGTVTSATTISFTAEVTDENSNTDDQALSIIINPALAITTTTLQDWTAGFMCNQALSSSGGTPEITWSDKYDDLSGTGLSVAATGSLDGVPSAAGLIEFTALAVDNAGAEAEQALQMTINAAIDITTESLPDWTEGMAYDQSLLATGGTGELSWTDKFDELVGDGMVLTSTGQITGTPNSAGTIEFTANATDEIGAFDEQLYQFTINAPVSITTSTLPDGVEGESYSIQLESTGGTGGNTWSDVYDDLSGTGLSIGSNGLLSGTPATVGTISFTAGCVDVPGSSDEQAFSFDIEAAFMCGDTNNDENIDLLDILGIIDYVYGDPPGAAPNPLESADVNSDTNIDLLDILALIDYVYGDPPGPAPDCP